MFLVSCIFFNECLYFSYYVAEYFLDNPRGVYTFFVRKIADYALHLVCSYFNLFNPFWGGYCCCLTCTDWETETQSGEGPGSHNSSVAGVRAEARQPVLSPGRLSQGGLWWGMVESEIYFYVILLIYSTYTYCLPYALSL